MGEEREGEPERDNDQWKTISGVMAPKTAGRGGRRGPVEEEEDAPTHGNLQSVCGRAEQSRTRACVVCP